jgi:hypothetical protein
MRKSELWDRSPPGPEPASAAIVNLGKKRLLIGDGKMLKPDKSALVRSCNDQLKELYAFKDQAQIHGEHARVNRFQAEIDEVIKELATLLEVSLP